MSGKPDRYLSLAGLRWSLAVTTQIKLRPVERLLLDRLAIQADESGYCYATQGRLVELTGLTDREVRRSLQRLGSDDPATGRPRVLDIEDGSFGDNRRRRYHLLEFTTLSQPEVAGLRVRYSESEGSLLNRESGLRVRLNRTQSPVFAPPPMYPPQPNQIGKEGTTTKKVCGGVGAAGADDRATSARPQPLVFVDDPAAVAEPVSDDRHDDGGVGHLSDPVTDGDPAPTQQDLPFLGAAPGAPAAAPVPAATVPLLSDAALARRMTAIYNETVENTPLRRQALPRSEAEVAALIAALDDPLFDGRNLTAWRKYCAFAAQDPHCRGAANGKGFEQWTAGLAHVCKPAVRQRLFTAILRQLADRERAAYEARRQQEVSAALGGLPDWYVPGDGTLAEQRLRHDPEFAAEVAEALRGCRLPDPAPETPCYPPRRAGTGHVFSAGEPRRPAAGGR